MTSILNRFISRPLGQIHIQSLAHGHLINLKQARYAGHAKWQNIRSTKQAHDLAKGRTTSRYVSLVRRAIISNGMQTDPKLNGKLAEVLTEASKMNIAKATLERAIARTVNLKIYTVNVEIQGPGGCALIARCETENVSSLRRDLKKNIKKHDANLVLDDTFISMFKSQGYIRTETETADGRPINEDFAEEAAIIANAQEVCLEPSDIDTGDDPINNWVFYTDADTLNTCRAELEKRGFKVISSDVDLVPYRAVDFGSDTYEKLVELIKVLRETDQVVDVFHNVLPPPDTSG